MEKGEQTGSYSVIERARESEKNDRSVSERVREINERVLMSS